MGMTQGEIPEFVPMWARPQIPLTVSSRALYQCNKAENLQKCNFAPTMLFPMEMTAGSSTPTRLPQPWNKEENP